MRTRPARHQRTWAPARCRWRTCRGPVGSPPAAATCWPWALTAAALAGLARGALDLGVDYAKARRQFGVAIGAFQAVQHRLADVATAVEGARWLAYEAAWAQSEDPGRASALASMAMLFSAASAEQAASASLHFHGGYGFMLEYDIQLYFRRAKGWALVNGDPGREYRRLAALLFGTEGG
jgi:alkylation response protein AidB-like acyl-CoA dehydrogenase